MIGVYPLLPDETCWFLAVDFDKHAWTEDVAAFRETCHALEVPIAIERSRSGNGAHAWFFFAAPIAAAMARKMGCYLLTEAMARRHRSKLDSYDRLFPNQDTMPKGGYGNLIALPLQGEARRHGNSVFVDEATVPYPDQWAYLAALEHLSAERIEQLVLQAERRDQVLGVRMAVTEDDPTPWVRRPTPRRPRLTGPLPESLDVVLANSLFIAKEGLPSSLMNQLVRLAAFQNPEFYKKQAMRMSTVGTPRILTCAEEHSHHLALPRGCLPELEALCQEHGMALRLEDKRDGGVALDLAFQGELTTFQHLAADTLLANDFGVFVAPPGTGKTVVGVYAIAARRCSTLVLVDRKPLLEQWRKQLAQFLGLPLKDIGQIGGGKHRPTGRIDVAMLQSLSRRKDDAPALARYGHVLVDECHHVAAKSFEDVMKQLAPRYVAGFAAPAVGPDGAIQAYYAALVADAARNALILSDVERALAEGRSPLLLTERKDHLEGPPISGPGCATSSSSWAERRPSSSARPLRSSLRFRLTKRVCSWQPAGSSAKGSTTRASTPCSWPCPSPGRAPSCNTPVACTATTQARPRYRSTTTSTPASRCSPGCSGSGPNPEVRG